MPGPFRKVAAQLPILVILIAMTSIRNGTSLAKSLFLLVGAPKVTALRPALKALVLVVMLRPWRLCFSPAQCVPLLLYDLALGAMGYLFYLSLQRIPLGVAIALKLTGPLAVTLLGSCRPLDSIWAALAILRLWYLLPLGQNATQVDLTDALFVLSASTCWTVYILARQHAGEEHEPATMAVGSLIASLVLVPLGMVQATDTLWQWLLLPMGLGIAIFSTVLPYSLEMMALTRLPTHTFGTPISLEPVLAALPGMVFLDETLKLSQTLVLSATIIVSMGAALTIQRQSKIEQVDIDQHSVASPVHEEFGLFS